MRRLTARFVPVTFIFFVAQVALLAGTRLAYPGERPDPFVSYEAMMPGHAIPDEDAPCEFQTMYAYAPTMICSHRADGIFTSINSTTQDGRFVSTHFVAHNLRLGDIVRHWGRPDRVSRLGLYSIVIWVDQGLYGIITPVVRIEPFNYMASVESLTIGLQET